MTERAPDGPDPRYDPAFQRGFAGDVERLRSDERAYARPRAADADRPSAESAPPRRGLRRAPAPTPAPAPPPLPLGEEAAEADRTSAPDPAGATGPAAPLRSNPFFWALLAAGLVGTLIGIAMLASAISAPPVAYGSGATPEAAWVLRQVVYYSSVPMIGCLPVALLLAAAVAALRWRPSAPAAPVAPDDDGDGDGDGDGASVLFD